MYLLEQIKIYLFTVHANSEFSIIFVQVHMMTVNVPGASWLWDVAANSSWGVLFVTDRTANKIHVLHDNLSYIHNISTPGWQPHGLDVNGNFLFVVDHQGDKLYKIELDQDLMRVGSDQVISNHGAPILDSPIFVSVSSEKIVLSSWYTIALTNMAGDVEWVAGTGLLGSGPGEFDHARGELMDAWGRVIVADSQNNRIQLLSARGTKIQDLTTDMSGMPYDVLLMGNTLYVYQSAPNMLIKYTINYA